MTRAAYGRRVGRGRSFSSVALEVDNKLLTPSVTIERAELCASAEARSVNI